MIFYNIELLNKRNETKHPKENTLLLLGEKKNPSDNKRLCIAHDNNIS